jgi:TonB family protein
VHGSLCPANILAAGDQVKLSSDSLHRAGEAWAHRSERAIYDAPERESSGITPAADVWSLGVTLVEALTQRLPEWGPGTPPAPVLPGRLPEPFAEMVYRSLIRDAKYRWSVTSLRACAEGQADAPPAGKPARNRLAWIAAGTAVVLAAAFGGYRWLRDDTEEVRPALVTEPEPQPAPARAQARPSPSGRAAAPSSTPAPTAEPAPQEAPEPTEGIVRQILPDVPRAAQDTIQGSFAVEVRVSVDAAGDVADAALISPGPSRYFAALALEAARKWKFAPAPPEAGSAERAWVLRFRFDRFSTRVAVSEPGP